ncbi:MAG: 6-pyruvoyl tetrahydropterin synthase family protein [Candidatus Lokiarchaeota archaeon]|nr:6-pyruvoyl tetrahydropterin synthase family protein [Candidatus Lokiarchaeota archaeon]
MSYKVIVNATRIKFSASHFLKEPSQCSKLHGHNYYVSVEIEAPLDENYFVVDFIELQEKIKTIVKPLDHSVLVPELSSDLVISETSESIEIVTTTNKRYVFPKTDVTLMPLPATTSELLAKFVHDKLKEIYSDKRITVKLEESKSATAVYKGD